MRKSIYFSHLTFVLGMFSAVCAMGQERPLDLTNPDGSVAANCQAIAVIIPGVYLNEQLELPSTSASSNVPTPSSGAQIVPMSTNKSGLLLISAHAKAVVAQNAHGFAFVPFNALSGKAKLRPWAKLKIDASAFPEKLRSKYHLRIVWRNCYAGDLPSNVTDALGSTDNPFGSFTNDPFGDRPSPSPDWRFHNYVTRFQLVDIVDQTVTVPPGEVSIELDVLGSESASPSSMPLVTLGIVRTASNQIAEFEVPEFGSAQGQLLIGKTGLPDWDETNRHAIIALPVGAVASPQQANQNPLLQVSSSDPFSAGGLGQLNRDTDRLSRWTAARSRNICSVAVPTDEQGNFTFDVLPIGGYELRMSVPDATNNNSTGYGSTAPLTAVGSGTPRRQIFAIKANESTDLGSVAIRIALSDLEQAKSSEMAVVEQTVASPPDTETTSNFSAATAQSRIEAALNKPVEDIAFNATPFWQVVDTLSNETNTPILLNLPQLELLGFDKDTPITLNLPPVTLRSTLNHLLAQLPNWDLAFVIRDEVVLITTGRDAVEKASILFSQTQTIATPAASAKTPTADDGATEIVERWLQSAPQNADRSELKQLLETHLSAEFDASQQTRRAEIGRLQQLLEQSLTWLDQRQQQREKIIQQRVQELLK